jgi:Glycosyl hydrolases family 2, sugar binding domain
MILNSIKTILLISLIAFTFNSFSQIQSLAGQWQFRLDSVQTFSSIHLPGSCEEQGFGAKSLTKDPNRLTREFKYVGKAWYERTIEVPTSWKGKRLELFLERCLWESSVWLDDKLYGSQNSLSTPHSYDFGFVAPGKHTIKICIDNTIKLPIGPWGFAIADDTQGNWNGIIGRIELHATPPVWIRQVDVFADHLKIKVGNITGKIQRSVLQNTNHIIPASGGVVEIPFKSLEPNWNEFSPQINNLKITLKTREYTDIKFATYGIRSLTTKNGQFILNGRPTLMRGPNNECVYPKTQYPPMDKESWLHLFGICKSYGFNFMRFNSWCPPEAAFIAANELGYFLQVEIPFWSIFTTGYGEDQAREKFLSDELTKILENYGNNPSFAFMAMGNESPGPMEVLVKQGKGIDTRMLYRCQNGDTITNGDYAERGTEIGMRGVKGPRTDWDRWSLIHTPEVEKYKQMTMPTIGHEIGQWASYPDFDQLSKFTGNLKPYNYENYRNSLASHDMADQNKAFARASGKFAVSLYKDEIEGCFRTWPFGGFGIVEARDFTGEGCAIIGWLDAFWDSKDLITPDEFRRFCAPTICLVRMPKRIFTNSDEFIAQAEIAHYALKNIKSEATWKIENEKGHLIASGSFGIQEIKTGKVNRLGEIRTSLKRVEIPSRLIVTLSAAGTSNSWNIWVYPNKQPEQPKNVRISYAFDEQTKQALARGENVLLFSSPKEGLNEIQSSFMGPDEVRLFPSVTKGRSAIPGSFMPAFWSMRLFNQIGTLGILCNPKHPALSQFPTQEHSDWQWADLLGRYTAQTSYKIAGDNSEYEWDDRIDRSKAIILNETPANYRPILQAIDNYERNYKLGIIFETSVGKGKLLICALDLETDSANRPAARQLKTSMLNYASGDQFNPPFELPMDFLDKILTYQ